MIPYQQQLNQSVEARYHRLAGPFDETTLGLLEGMKAFLNATGVRYVTVGEACGVCVWRLKSECETMEETEKRLRRQKTLRHRTQDNNR